MALFLLKKPDCVFIHIPKTAGTSIRKGVWKKRCNGPRFGGIPQEWQGLFSFAFVRDPISRFMSAYRMFTQGPVGDPDWKPSKGQRQLNLDEFLDIVLDDSIIYDERRKSFEEKIRHHTIPQTHPFNCLRDASFVGRFWKIEDDFARIGQRLGFEGKLPLTHYTRKNPEAPDQISRNIEAKLRQYYSEDFAFLEDELDERNQL